MPPSYGSQEYWNQRFTNEPEPFEWLEAPHVLDPFISKALKSVTVQQPKLLHIGCGTSRLSHHLPGLVQKPSQIHNVDYSQVAIDLGRKRECEVRDAKQIADVTEHENLLMRWHVIDLLAYTSVLDICRAGTYSIIVDKSTSDCIACSDDVNVTLPYAIDVDPHVAFDLELSQKPKPLHPLHVLAVHLALITVPGARWIALSYSNDRFPFADGLFSSRPHFPGFPDTGTLWKLVEKTEVESTKEETTVEETENGVIYRPKVIHWVYVLERTTVPLHLRGAHV